MAFTHHLQGLRCSTCDHAATFFLVWGQLCRRPYPKDGGLTAWVGDTERFVGLFTCGTCQAPTAAVLRFRKAADQWVPVGQRDRFVQRLEVVTTSSPKGRRAAIVTSPPPRSLNDVCEVEEVWPAAQLAVPRDLPPEIERFWIHDLASQSSSRGLALMSRAALEHMLKHRGANGKNLALQIDDMAKRGVITAEVARWAHEIRLLGNISAHGIDEIDPAEAAEVFDFTLVIAELLFSYPARVERYRLNRQES